LLEEELLVESEDSCELVEEEAAAEVDATASELSEAPDELFKLESVYALSEAETV
jgi:hypothetical protein